ncbi:hypothetical protein TW95_gp1396 [Pandoravirus inopinatum]|uniref:Uncharacterized protein n=1 Tax=Pandoravirus inopinatum TaxID=1605721 RepID=A0A0B5J890_9VIRU|nr:hypothetical protein TW95_gp1396 [Pandoravirus inopinatum]AJF98130.1 hypothetical protein [Pandoravirus inopinatum]
MRGARSSSTSFPFFGVGRRATREHGDPPGQPSVPVRLHPPTHMRAAAPSFFSPFCRSKCRRNHPATILVSLFSVSLVFSLWLRVVVFFLFDTARSAASWSVLADNQMACCRADRQWAAWIMTGAISDTDQIRQCCLAHCK